MLDKVRDDEMRFASVAIPERHDAATLRAGQAFVRRRWVVVLAVTVVVLLATGCLLRSLPAHYTARAEVLLEPRREHTPGSDESGRSGSVDAADIESALVVIRSTGLLARVVDEASLPGDPAFGAGPGRFATLATLFGRAERAFPDRQAPDVRAESIDALARALRVERLGKAPALAIAVTARDPATAARLANAVAETFVRDQRGAQLEASRRAATFFAERLGPLGEALRRSEDVLDAFRRDHDLIAKTTAAQSSAGPTTINEQQLADLNARLATARAETAQAGARFNQAQALGTRGGTVEAVPDVVRSPLIGQLREQQAIVARKEADLSARYTDGYPLLVNVRAERREIDRAIAREVARIVANLKGAYDIARSQEGSLRAGIATATAAAGLDSDLGSRLRALERVKLVDQTVFETYLARAKAAEQQASFEAHDVRVVSPARTPDTPAFPQTGLVLACMAVFGLGLGVAVGMLLDALDVGFRTLPETEAALGLPVLAAVPYLGRRERVIEGRLLDPARFIAASPHSLHAEAVHAIRAGIRMSEGPPAQVVLVTSAASGEGKSLIALSLALSAARAGQRVLLLDADLRSPALSRYFGVENRLGLVDMLSGIVGTSETTVTLGAGLAIMPSGRQSAVAPDLFASRRMERYLEHLRGNYDLVVIDAAPAGTVVDALVLSDLSDRIVVVVGWCSTARDAVARTIRTFRHHRKIAGLVLNKVDERRLPSYGRARRPAASAGQGAGA